MAASDTLDPVDRARAAFTEAAIEWAAGGRGHPLVDAAAQALTAGLDSPTLRVLAGAPRVTADDEARELAAIVFQELGPRIRERPSPEAIVEGARQRARRLLSDGGSLRELAHDLRSAYVGAGYPSELAVWSGIGDGYDMVEHKVITGSVEEVRCSGAGSCPRLGRGSARTPDPFGRRFHLGSAAPERRW